MYNFDDGITRAAARTVNIEDITTDECNREILRKLKENDPVFDELGLCSTRQDEYDYYCPQSEYDFCPEDTRSLRWIGHFIGRNTILKELNFANPFQDFHNNTIESFCRGLNSNRSIQKIGFYEMGLSGGELFQSLRSFFENNNNISELAVSGCEFGPGSAQQLSLALRGCNKSLKSVKFRDNQMGGELVDTITALSAHPQLEELKLWSMYFGRNERTALVNLLREASGLQELTLFCCSPLQQYNVVDDEGVEALVGGLTNSRLRSLDLSNNSIAARGCQSLATLLQNPNSNLDELYLNHNIIDNEGAHILANALTSNRKLKTLRLECNDFTEGWSGFSKVLCDTSSINNTFHSNHTLECLASVEPNMPADVRSLLELNRSSDDKKQVAMKKILKHHQHFDMQPFFEWDLKVLPTAMSWFERAQSIYENNEAGIDKQKLSAMYQFIRAMPDVFEPAPAAAGEKEANCN